MIEIRANGNANQQVSEPVKRALHDELQRAGVDSDAVLITHFCGGEWVSVSLRDSIADISDWNVWLTEKLDEYWRNKMAGDDVIWLHGEWVDRHLDVARQPSD